MRRRRRETGAQRTTSHQIKKNDRENKGMAIQGYGHTLGKKVVLTRRRVEKTLTLWLAELARL